MKIDGFQLLTQYYLSFYVHACESVHLKYYFHDIEHCAESRLYDAIRDPPPEVHGKVPVPPDMKAEILLNKIPIVAQIKQFLSDPKTQKRFSQLKAEEDRELEEYQRAEDAKTRKREHNRELKKLAKTAEKLLSLGSDLDEMTAVLRESVVRHTHDV